VHHRGVRHDGRAAGLGPHWFAGMAEAQPTSGSAIHAQRRAGIPAGRTSGGHVGKTGRQLPFGPMIRSKLPARNLSLGDAVDLDCVVIGPTPAAPLDLVDQGNTESEPALPGPLAEQEPLGGGKCARESHTVNLDMMSKFVNPCLNRLFVQPCDHGLMPTDYEDIYPKRPLFKEWVAVAKAKLGARSNAEVAPIMGYAPSTLNKMLGKSPTHKPSDTALKLLGDFIGRDYRLLLDEPETAPEGISDELWAKLSKRKPIIAVSLLTDLETIPDGEVDNYLKLWDLGYKMGLARIAAEEEASHKIKKFKTRGGKKSK